MNREPKDPYRFCHRADCEHELVNGVLIRDARASPADGSRPRRDPVQAGPGLRGRGPIRPMHAKHYVMARDADARPSRAITPLNEMPPSASASGPACRAGRHGTRDFEAEQPSTGCSDSSLFEDYVHPKPAGHRLIARSVWPRDSSSAGCSAMPRPAEIDEFDAAVLRSTTASRAKRRRRSTPALLFNLAVVLENQGRIDEAMDNYRACLALHPDYYVARANLARLLARQGRHAQAADEHRAVLETEPGYVRSMLGLGQALRRMGRLEPALQMFERAQANGRVVAREAWRLEGAPR